MWADILLKEVMFVKRNCGISLVSLFKVEVIMDIYHYWKLRKLQSTLCGLHVIFLLPQENPLKHKQQNNKQLYKEAPGFKHKQNYENQYISIDKQQTKEPASIVYAQDGERWSGL